MLFRQSQKKGLDSSLRWNDEQENEPKPELDSRLRGNDEQGKCFSVPWNNECRAVCISPTHACKLRLEEMKSDSTRQNQRKQKEADA